MRVLFPLVVLLSALAFVNAGVFDGNDKYDSSIVEPVFPSGFGKKLVIPNSPVNDSRCGCQEKTKDVCPNGDCVAWGLMGHVPGCCS